MKEKQLTLGELGEFRLINDLILPTLKDVSVTTPLGDDCGFAELQSGDRDLVVTTDVTPKPLVWELGYSSFYAWGWYSVLSNVSDLATTGADPVAFTSSVEASSSMTVSDFEDFFSGLHDACKDVGIPNAGGNINEGETFSCHGTAIGTVPKGRKITRSGASPGDAVYVVGDSGNFISLYLKARREGFESLADCEIDRLIKPKSLLQQMRALREANVLMAASDNSDGILGSLWNLAERSEVGIEINLQRTMLPEFVLWTASTERLNPWNLFLFWGDWQQVVAVNPNSIEDFESIVESHNTRYTHLGTALEHPAALYGNLDGKRKRLNLVRNENFSPYSYNGTPQDSLEHMLHAPLFNGQD